MLATGSESPVVVVLSGSMEPGFHRGDILFLNLGSRPARAGEVVVFNLDGRDIPIVHRVIKVHERAGDSGHLDILTKVCACVLEAWRGARADGNGRMRCVACAAVLGVRPSRRRCHHHPTATKTTTTTTTNNQTKQPQQQGDNNHMDDRLLYNRGQEWLHMRHIVGRAVGFLPHVGMVTIVMNDYPWLKVALIAVLGLLVITSKE